MDPTLEAVYADGWDHGLVNPLTRPAADLDETDDDY